MIRKAAFSMFERANYFTPEKGTAIQNLNESIKSIGLDHNLYDDG